MSESPGYLEWQHPKKNYGGVARATIAATTLALLTACSSGANTEQTPQQPRQSAAAESPAAATPGIETLNPAFVQQLDKAGYDTRAEAPFNDQMPVNYKLPPDAIVVTQNEATIAQDQPVTFVGIVDGRVTNLTQALPELQSGLFTCRFEDDTAIEPADFNALMQQAKDTLLKSGTAGMTEKEFDFTRPDGTITTTKLSCTFVTLQLNERITAARPKQ